MGSVIATPGANARIQDREITFDLNSAQPPINQYISKDDQLFIMTSSTLAINFTATIFARMMMPDGNLQQSQWTVVIQPQRAGNFTGIPLPECFLLSCSCISNSAFGQNIYVQATIARGLPSLGFQHLVLFKGFPTFSMPLSWPWGVNQTNVDASGALRSITGTTPAAGANLSETVPANAKWRPIAMTFTLTCSAAVANRGLVMVVDDGVSIYATGAHQVVITASQVVTVCASASPELNSSIILMFSVNLFGGVLMMGGHRIRSTIQNLQAADQISGLQYLVEEWLLP